MFPATNITKPKMPEQKPKTKENCNSEILHISLPQIILLQKDT